MGLRDGVNQNFFILSMTDALQGVIVLADSIIFIFELASVQFETVSNYQTACTLRCCLRFPIKCVHHNYHSHCCGPLLLCHNAFHRADIPPRSQTVGRHLDILRSRCGCLGLRCTVKWNP
ncbi:hypothetical protein RRG08_005799 [Elysia crispata]|uniref:Uncharacterized protein n=1 Tax=Elysia crispata TaxID=231223 RepID=A0AAE1DMW6_9GAST|nr:hypothetical protein RRG08_005799 [Elysia crispata]